MSTRSQHSLFSLAAGITEAQSTALRMGCRNGRDIARWQGEGEGAEERGTQTSRRRELLQTWSLGPLLCCCWRPRRRGCCLLQLGEAHYARLVVGLAVGCRQAEWRKAEDGVFSRLAFCKVSIDLTESAVWPPTRPGQSTRFRLLSCRQRLGTPDQHTQPHATPGIRFQRPSESRSVQRNKPGATVSRSRPEEDPGLLGSTGFGPSPCILPLL